MSVVREESGTLASPRSIRRRLAPARNAWRSNDLLARELAKEARARSGFYLAPLGIMIGIALFYGADLRATPIPLSITMAILAVLLAVGVRNGLSRALLMVATFALVGQALAVVELRRTDTTIFSGEATVRIDGRVIWRDVDDRGRYRYLIDIEGTERPTLSRPPDRARILVSSRHDPIPIGGRYDGLVRLRPPSGPALPGSYDFAYGPFFQGLGAYGYSLGAPERAGEVSAADLGFSERVAALRVEMAMRIRDTVPGAEGAVASALITGERAGIPDEIDEWLRITGLAHVLSISGFHMALIAGFTMLSVRAAASMVPGLPLLVSTKKIAAVAALIVSTAYLLIAGDNVATQRSWIMLVVMLFAVLIDRPAITLRNVAIAALFVMALNPHAVLTASFQMSFAATAALVGAYGALMRWWNGREEHLGRRERGVLLALLVTLAGLALSSLIAGGATTPYGAYHFGRAAPLGGVIANVAAMPLFSFWIMPAALIAVLAMPFGLDGPFLHLMGYGLGAVFAMAEHLANWFPDHATGRMTPLSLVLFSAGVLVLCFFAGRLRWFAVPLALVGLYTAPPRGEPPELLIFEDGKEVALLDRDGRLIHLKERPNDFVAAQWIRAFPQRADETPGGGRGARAGIALPGTGAARTSDGSEPDVSSVDPSAAGFICSNDDICRATTRSGLTVGWTQDYEKTGFICDAFDIAIVSRAIRLSECRSGAHLVTLRTLRRTGSLAVARHPADGSLLVETSIGTTPSEWNLHRHAPWPEYWENPERTIERGAPTEAEIPRTAAPGQALPVGDQ